MKTLSTYTIYIVCLSLIMSFFGNSFVVYAAQDNFKVRMTVAEPNLVPPSVPTDLTATAISDDQIDLAWTASTDDISVSGYRIFRDSLFIATTTLTSYSDFDLDPVTPYTYEVEAFDSSINLSGLSDPAIATTSDVAVATTTPTTVSPNPSSGSGGTSLILRMFDITVLPDVNSVSISFSTNIDSRAQIYWGETSDHELGTLAIPFYKGTHQVAIGDLKDNTQYFLDLVAIDTRGVAVSEKVIFTTVSNTPLSPLPNPSNFKATPTVDKIVTSWTNPRDPRFAGVRLIRSDKFFPRDIYDGDIIYEGNDSSYEDTNVVVGKTYYYAIFAQAKDGSFSSGALAQSRIPKPGEVIGGPVDPFTGLPQALNVHPQIAGLTLADFDFIQDGRILTQYDNTIAIDGTKNLTIHLAYSKVPEVLKTIAFTLVDPYDASKIFPFLLRVNESKSLYEATIGPLGRSGKYSLNIVILDYKNQGLKRLGGTLQALVAQIPGILDKKNFSGTTLFMFFLLIALLLIVILLINRRQRKEETLKQAPETVLVRK